MSHLSDPGNGGQGVHQKLPLSDVEPGHCLSVQHHLLLCAIFADEADMEVDEQLRKVESACSPTQAVASVAPVLQQYAVCSETDKCISEVMKHQDLQDPSSSEM